MDIHLYFLDVRASSLYMRDVYIHENSFHNERDLQKI